MNEWDVEIFNKKKYKSIWTIKIAVYLERRLFAYDVENIKLYANNSQFNV